MLEQDTQKVLNLLEKLINFKSINGESKEIIAFLKNFLEKEDFTCYLKRFGETDEKKIDNLYATYGGTQYPNICFAGHTDVVPSHNPSFWTCNPFQLLIKDNQIYGRGVVDMKGAIACSILASINFINKNFKSKNKNLDASISFLITGDEEGPAINGTKKMIPYVHEEIQKIDFCILGEPTSQERIGDTIKISRRGSANFKLKIFGKEGHSAYPQYASNPLDIALNFAQNLQLKSQDWNNSTVTLTSIDTNNQTTNSIPAEVLVTFNIRFPYPLKIEEINLEICSIIEKFTTKYNVSYKCNAHPFAQKRSNQIDNFIKIIENTTGLAVIESNSGGTSDSRFLYKYCEVAELGLLSREAHKINEKCKIEDLQMLYKIYYNYLNYAFRKFLL